MLRVIIDAFRRSDRIPHGSARFRWEPAAISYRIPDDIGVGRQVAAVALEVAQPVMHDLAVGCFPKHGDA
jgi:hypothetical protein